MLEKKAFSRGDKEKAVVLGRQRGRAARQGKGQEGRRNGKEEKEEGARRDTGVRLGAVSVTQGQGGAFDPNSRRFTPALL